MFLNKKQGSDEFQWRLGKVQIYLRPFSSSSDQISQYLTNSEISFRFRVETKTFWRGIAKKGRSASVCLIVETKQNREIIRQWTITQWRKLCIVKRFDTHSCRGRKTLFVTSLITKIFNLLNFLCGKTNLSRWACSPPWRTLWTRRRCSTTTIMGKRVCQIWHHQTTTSASSWLVTSTRTDSGKRWPGCVIFRKLLLFLISVFRKPRYNYSDNWHRFVHLHV